MDLIAQSVAKINDMEDSDMKGGKLETRMSTTPRCLDTAAIVYHYLQGVSPAVASLFLEIAPDVHMDCSITLEEVVQEWKINAEKEAGKSTLKLKKEANVRTKNKDSEERIKFKTYNPKAAYNEKKTKISLIPDDIKKVGASISVQNESSHGRRIFADHQRTVKISQKSNDDKPSERNEGSAARKTSGEIVQKVRKCFTPGEDSIILNKIEEMGNDLNIKELAEELGRSTTVIHHRVRKLKIEGSRMNRKIFSLAEDEAILEMVLPGLQKYNLLELVLHDGKDLDDLATALGRPNKGHSLSLRWAHILQPWIMQYYAGTLNLDIRMMLVNHLAETYLSRKSINWDAVAEKSEFAGHTVINLKRIFSQLLKASKRAIRRKTETTEISWKQTLDGCREYIRQARMFKSEQTELRRTQVIDYYVKYVEKHR